MSPSSTPRIDAAERFFYEPGRPPVGFVDSGLARVLEFELNRALEQLRQLGAQLPPPLDDRTQAQLRSLQRPKRNVLGQIASSAATDATDICWIDDHARYALSVTAHARVRTPIVVAQFQLHQRLK